MSEESAITKIQVEYTDIIFALKNEGIAHRPYSLGTPREFLVAQAIEDACINLDCDIHIVITERDWKDQ